MDEGYTGPGMRAAAGENQKMSSPRDINTGIPLELARQAEVIDELEKTILHLSDRLEPAMRSDQEGGMEKGYIEEAANISPFASQIKTHTMRVSSLVARVQVILNRLDA